jgi:hypothetical protein
MLKKFPQRVFFAKLRLMKNLIKVGSAITGLSLVVLVYNFFNMYSLVAKCPEDINLQSCQAYDNWKLINQIGIALLILGIFFLVIGYIKRQRKN